MKDFAIGLVVGLLILPVFGFFYIRGGHMPVAAADNPMPFEKFLAQGGLRARIQKEAPQKEATEFTPSDLVIGAQIFQRDCVFCHGSPQQSPFEGARGMFPHPPRLFTDEMVTDDPLGHSYWVVRNGIRLSGMPGFKESLSEQQIWQISALLARADKLPPEVVDAFRAAAAGLPVLTSPASSAPAATPSTPPQH
jgi:thiosulfate dehydrogenase